MTALRILIPTESNEQRRDGVKLGDPVVISASMPIKVGQVKAVELLDDHRLAVTVELEAAASVVRGSDK